MARPCPNIALVSLHGAAASDEARIKIMKENGDHLPNGRRCEKRYGLWGRRRRRWVVDIYVRVPCGAKNEISAPNGFLSDLRARADARDIASFALELGMEGWVFCNWADKINQSGAQRRQIIKAFCGRR